MTDRSEIDVPLLSDFDPTTGIATLTFNRPHVLNALNLEMAEAFVTAVKDLTRLSGLRCVVLRGAGKAFMAGGDVASFADDPEGAGALLNKLLDAMNPAVLTLRSLDAPVLAAVTGAAAGAGFSLVLAADRVIAREDAALVMAYGALATTPDCSGSHFMLRKLGYALSMDMMLTGRRLPLDEAMACHAVNEVVAETEFDSRVTAAAHQLASLPTSAIGQFKRLMESGPMLAEQLERERAAFTACTATVDFRNATRGFVDKQRVVFVGR